MRAGVCSEFLHHLDSDGELKVGHSSKRFAACLEKANLPWDLQHLLRFDWPQRSGYLAHLRFNSAKEILADEFLGDLLKHHFLPIGSAPNGDMLVVRFDSDRCEVGFLTHEEYWDQKEDPVKIYEPIAPTLESLLFRIVEGRYIPTDYYAAKEFNAFLTEDQGPTCKRPARGERKKARFNSPAKPDRR
jgi:hypothetical protein